MLTTLTLKRSPAPLRKAAAWLLPGGDAEAWLAETSRWPVPAEDVSYYLLAAPAGIEPVAALAVVPEGTRVPRGTRAQPYGLAAPGVYVPVDAMLWPQVTAEELRAATRFPVLIFHPALGLTGCEETDRRCAWDLLAAPLRDFETNWSAARAGPPAPSRMGALQLRVELSLEGLFGPESEDIGGQPLDQLPPSADEPGGGAMERILRNSSSALAKGLLGLTSLVPRGSGPETWVNRLENWATNKRDGVTKETERERHKELHRLLEKLTSNPEEGLRFAIPLAALMHRGLAAAAARLGPRGTDFNLGRLGGGGAADFWDVPDDLRSSLSKKYREMAMRELALGRHRRAAYILAELLGDFAGAADALKQGKYFREAALLYREHLRNPTAAAACFAEGGMIDEALSIYEKHAMWMEVADLHARLGNRDAECAALRRIVEARLKAGDTVAAAQLVETRLREPDEALALLAAAWPRDKNALACLEERFALLDRLHRPREAQALLETLTHESTPRPTLAPLANLLAKIFENSAEIRTRVLAAEAVRVKVAHGLEGRTLDRSDELALLRSLTRLAPGDRLLKRDAVRFQAQRPPPPAPPPLPPTQPGFVRRITLEKAGGLSLPLVGGWVRAVGDAQRFFVVSRTPRHGIFFCRGSWTQGVQSVNWPDPAPAEGFPFVMTPHLVTVVLARTFSARLPLKILPGTDAFNGAQCVVGTPDWLPEDTVATSSSRFGFWVVRAVGERVVLANFGSDRLIDSRDVTDELIAAGATGGGTSLVLEARGADRGVALGYNRHIMIHGKDVALRVEDLGERIVGLIPLHGQVPGWIALLERGATFVSSDAKIVHRFDDSLQMPRGAFLGDNLVVLVGGEEGLIVKLQPSGPARLAYFQIPGGAGIGLTPATTSREFAVFDEKGSVQRWKFAV